MNYGFRFSYKLIDNQLLEVLGPYSIMNEASKSSSITSNYHLGKIASYTF